MPQHRPEVLTTGPGTAVATCSCGWVGGDRRDAGTAKLDANVHKVEAMRKDQADPNQIVIPGSGKVK